VIGRFFPASALHLLCSAKGPIAAVGSLQLLKGFSKLVNNFIEAGKQTLILTFSTTILKTIC
jgi:hypothetical protein